MPDMRKVISRALISVSDKTGLIDLARDLHAAEVSIVSTGSTARTIADAGIPVTPVEEVTGFAECLDGRVKTLHPAIHGGLLADLRQQSHRAQLQELGIAPFDLVIVNLYPFTQTVASGADHEACVEQIDIGGPAMVRASAKNYANVAVVVSPDRYGEVLEAIELGGFTMQERAALAAQAFAHTAAYDTAVAQWMARNQDSAEFPDWIGGSWQRVEILRYGENPHQSAAVYRSEHHEPGIADAEQLHGKAMSYNNYVDADAARRAAYEHLQPAVAIIKHANPCGIAIGSTIDEAYRRAFATDPVSAFGGVVAANRPVDEAMAQAMADVFTEVVIAPEFTDQALALLTAKANLRILRVSGPHPGRHLETRSISGGLLMQVADQLDATGDEPEEWTLVSGPPASAEQLQDLAFAWRACRSVKSNAILLASHGAAVGIGMGQVNRVDAARLAVERAGERALGSVAASDAFFPFADGLNVLLAAGITAVVQPGGSVRDAEVIAAAQESGVTMYVTGTRHFFH
jgi:phosphoribosylaminoimidazolecarboxamide formyltransferase/IMP cyclohydrolase